MGDCLRAAARSGFSRLPITSEDGRLLQAYVLVRDLLFLPREDHDEVVPARLRRSILLVDGRMDAYELFEEMRGQGRQLAVVVDDDGNPVGLVTLEDLIETVIGSIDDEFDLAAAPAVAADGGVQMNDIGMTKHDHVLAGLVFSLQAMAMQQLGKIQDPHSGEMHMDLDQARGTIDILEMLKAKCRTDTPPELLRMLDGAVMDLQLNYVDERKKQDKTRQQEPAAAEPGSAAEAAADDAEEPGA